jgi:hypothetical protein
MIIEISVPDEWTPARVLAFRTLLQLAIHGGQPLITAIRADVTPDELHDINGQVEALVREAGLAA